MKTGAETIREARAAVAEGEGVEAEILDGSTRLAVVQNDGRVVFLGTDAELGWLLERHRAQRRRGRGF